MGGATERMLAGRYHLTEVLGRGGMGVVWRATDTRLGRPVAIKELTVPDGASRQETKVLAARMLREARAAAQLRHPGVVTVYDVLEKEERIWIIMELVDTGTLDQRVRTQGPLSPAEAARLGLLLVEVLEAAHALGIVHRDIKPSNLLLARQGVKLADFGIAHLDGDPQLTASGIVLGSPAYMAPEQALGQRVGPLVDMWALGATLYFAVEGRPPFKREGHHNVLAAVVAAPPDPMHRAGSLAQLVTQLLEKDPERRPGAEAVRGALEAVAAGTGAPPPTTGDGGSTTVPEDGGPPTREQSRSWHDRVPRWDEATVGPGPVPTGPTGSPATRKGTAIRAMGDRIERVSVGLPYFTWSAGAAVLLYGLATTGFSSRWLVLTVVSAAILAVLAQAQTYVIAAGGVDWSIVPAVSLIITVETVIRPDRDTDLLRAWITLLGAVTIGGGVASIINLLGASLPWTLGSALVTVGYVAAQGIIAPAPDSVTSVTWFTDTARTYFRDDAPWMFAAMVAVIAVAWAATHASREHAGRLSEGMSVAKGAEVRFDAYGWSGLSVGFAALLYLASTEVLAPARLAPWTFLDVIAVALLSGTPLGGGRARLVTTLAGCWLIAAVGTLAEPTVTDPAAGHTVLYVIEGTVLAVAVFVFLAPRWSRRLPVRG